GTHRPPAPSPCHRTATASADRLCERPRPLPVPARVLAPRRIRGRPSRPRGLSPARAVRVLGTRSLLVAGGAPAAAAMAHGARRRVGTYGAYGGREARLRPDRARRGGRT